VTVDAQPGALFSDIARVPTVVIRWQRQAVLDDAREVVQASECDEGASLGVS
jgi:hypothetical protein